MKCELLAPAGNYQIAKAALYAGADALYLATERFGARAYAKNLSLEELEKICNIAHVLDKKIYVTVNTLIKDSELADVKSYLKEIYKLGVDAIITTDLAIIKYILDTMPGLECHISTQVGLKNLEDIKFFEELGAKRAVLAREVPLKEIKRIKENSKLPIEVFIHGALCVSYSGNCYMSSLLTLRSGNRGRCSQNCRYEYEILKDGKVCAPKANYLSMKDLNSFEALADLKKLGVDSLKIEGRMKDEAYVRSVVKSYRNKLNNPNYKTNTLNRIFHREYTKGFLANEDRGNIVYSLRSGNVGEYLGKIKYKNNYLYELNITKKVNLGDRIRIRDNNGKDFYFNILDLYNKNMKPVDSVNTLSYLKLKEIIPGEFELYKMKDKENITSIQNEDYKIPLTIYINGSLNQPLELSCFYKDKAITVYSDMLLQEAKNQGLSEETITKQLSKFDDNPFFIEGLYLNLEGNLFLTVSELNHLRLKMIEAIYSSNKKEAVILEEKELKPIKTAVTKKLICKCYTLEQANIAKELELENVYYGDSFISYTSTDYNRSSNDLLVANYGAFSLNRDKNLTTDYEFNVLNHESLAYLLSLGAKNVTISKELSYEEIRDLAQSFKNKYGFMPNIDMIVYGRFTLMTLNYCPIRHIGECPGCKEHQYELKDSTTSFPLLHEDCTTFLVNSKSTNLIDDLDKLYPYINRFRLDFTLEDAEETKNIILAFKDKLNNLDKSTHYFDKENNTRAYFKRKIL